MLSVMIMIMLITVTSIGVSFALGDITSLLHMKIFVFDAHKEQQQLMKGQHQWMLVVSKEIIHVQINAILNEDRMKIIFAFLP